MVPQLQRPSEHLPTNDETQPPPLVPSMAIRGLPPLRQSKFHVEVEERLLKIPEHRKINSYDPYCRLSNSCASFFYSEVVSYDHLVAISTIYTLLWILDDLLFDIPSDLLLQEYGIDRSNRIHESPHKIGEFLNNLNILFRNQEPPRDPIKIEAMWWKAGQELRRLSNPQWFDTFADSVMMHHRWCVSSQADIASDRFASLYVQDLESFTKMRAWNAGSLFMVNLVEFAKNAFLPDEVREQPVIQQMTNAAGVHCAFVNDIFSYDCEVKERNPRNIIMVLMEREDIPLPQAVWRTVELVNCWARIFLELETQLGVWDAEPWADALRRYVEGMKEFMAGSLYWHSLHKRYRNSDSVFPELRVITNVHHELQDIYLIRCSTCVNCTQQCVTTLPTFNN